MDSEHRHELKSNELADLIAHFPQFLKRNANTLIGIAVIIIALVTWPLFTKTAHRKTIVQESRVTHAIQMLNQDINIALQSYENDPDQVNPMLNTILANANALMEQADETDNRNLQALAHIKAGQAIRTELHLRPDRVSSETIDTQIEKARQAYEKAADLAGTATLKAMAQFGIGLCDEERGRTEQAAETYNSIINDESFAATVFPVLAQQRLDNMADNTVSFTFEQVPDEDIDALISYPENAVIEEMSTVEGAGQTQVLPEAPAEEAVQDIADPAADGQTPQTDEE